MSGQHEEWMARAEDDLKFAEVGLREDFFSQVCFHSQQCIEKAMKGALVALGRSYPRSHSLRELASELPEIDLRAWLEAMSILDGYYIPLCYPDAAPGMKSSGPPNREEAGEALGTARNVFNVISSWLNSKR